MVEEILLQPQRWTRDRDRGRGVAIGHSPDQEALEVQDIPGRSHVDDESLGILARRQRDLVLGPSRGRLLLQGRRPRLRLGAMVGTMTIRLAGAAAVVTVATEMGGVERAGRLHQGAPRSGHTGRMQAVAFELAYTDCILTDRC